MAAKDSDNICFMAKNITKVYPGTRALDSVDFTVYRGMVNVLVGENGAGKSTLMKILSGVEQPDEGELLLNGQAVRMSNPREADKHGVWIIHQELNLFPNLSVAQNMFMGKVRTRFGRIADRGEYKAKTKEILEYLGHSVDPDTSVSNLKVGMQQIVEIGRALSQDEVNVLIMDEPTSALSAAEVRVLFSVIEDLKKRGVGIVYISHRLDEVMEIGDVVTVLRDGRLIDHASLKDVDAAWIVDKMLGRGAARTVSRADKSKGEEILKVDSVSLPRPGGGYIFKNVSFTLRRGEILGLYGLLGSGRTELLECLLGVYPFRGGEVYLEGRKIKFESIAQQMRRGFALLPEDRQRHGLLKNLTIGQNLTLCSLRKCAKGFHLDKRRLKKAVERLVKDLFIKVSNTDFPPESLSGGNQQKVVLGKAVLTAPKVLLLDEPTRGIDVNAKREVFELIRKFADEGVGVILVDSEVNEMIENADRVIVLSKGEICAVFESSDLDEKSLVAAATVGHDASA